jgi:hypothetical protein
MMNPLGNSHAYFYVLSATEAEKLYAIAFSLKLRATKPDKAGKLITDILDNTQEFNGHELFFTQ